MAEKTEPYKTKTGKVLTDADIEAMADEAERGYDVEALKTRRRGRPMLGTVRRATSSTSTRSACWRERQRAPGALAGRLT